ncbi:Hcp family type VI secretion system effector [Cohnella candidum]|nr:type VI secretion system tube protein Hcp [Cohnella candidum]
MKALLLIVATVFLLVAGSGATAVAATTSVVQPAQNHDVYLKLDGVCGEAKAAKFANWIQLTGVDFGVTNSSSGAPTGGGSGAGKAKMDPFTVSKTYDCSSVPILTNSLSGKHIKSGEIDFVTRGEKPFTVLKVVMTDVMISDYQFSNMKETLTFSFGAIDFSYYAMDSGGKSKLPVQGGFDFKTGSVK